ncbi:MAG: winged helix-turn-helix transcriptional regulator [Candidatus Eremiobacteraeota bacterium]|nr:winged helix-turn-helix transcriptional regulator [Candidatus Eremiobacteraeota bacterium]
MESAEIRIGSARLRREDHSICLGERSIALTALEFRLLWYLAEREGRLLTRAQILAQVWDDRSGVPTRVVDVHVASLRKKLQDLGIAADIEGVRGMGYRFNAG